MTTVLSDLVLHFGGQLHQRVGASKETAFGSRRAEIAAEQAVHFEEARDHSRAAHYLGQAAQKALRRSGGRETVDLLTRAIQQLGTARDARACPARAVAASERRGSARDDPGLNVPMTGQ